MAESRQPPGIGRILLGLVLKIAVIAAFAALLFTLLFGLLPAPDNTMYPAVRQGDLVIYYRVQKQYNSRDLVVVKKRGQLQIRRVVAVAGDTVSLSADGDLMVNGYPQQENGIYTKTEPYTKGITFPVTLREGELFVLADNRTGAMDSRLYGPVPIRETRGAVITLIRRRGL